MRPESECFFTFASKFNDFFEDGFPRQSWRMVGMGTKFGDSMFLFGSNVLKNVTD